MPSATSEDTMIGTEHDARLALLVDHGGYCTCCDTECDLIGRGEARRVYLVDGVVYKVALRDSANRYEHDALTEWRTAGATWAPETSLWSFDYDGDIWSVVAMPYLPDDGGPVDETTLAAIKAAAPETCRENYVSHGGRTYLIDGGDIAYSPTTV
jgi:hypothetical protein